MFANRGHLEHPPTDHIARSPEPSPPVPQSSDVSGEESHGQHRAGIHESEDEMPYPEPDLEQTLLPPPNFKPFFTLIEDVTSGEQFHPYVHYVFADDDPVIITAASMRSLGLDEAQYLSQPSSEGIEKEIGREGQEECKENTSVESPLPPPMPGVNEHYLVIDIGPDGRSVLNTKSLSSSWQATNTGLRAAPSFDESSLDQGFMLRIEGVKISNSGKGKDKSPAERDMLSDTSGQSPGNIMDALDKLLCSVENSLDIAAKISEPPRMDSR